MFHKILLFFHLNMNVLKLIYILTNNIIHMYQQKIQELLYKYLLFNYQNNFKILLQFYIMDDLQFDRYMNSNKNYFHKILKILHILNEMNQQLLIKTLLQNNLHQFIMSYLLHILKIKQILDDQLVYHLIILQELLNYLKFLMLLQNLKLILHLLLNYLINKMFISNYHSMLFQLLTFQINHLYYSIL